MLFVGKSVRDELADHYETVKEKKWRRLFLEREVEAESLKVKQGDMISFLNVDLWAIEAGKTIPFTLALWATMGNKCP